MRTFARVAAVATVTVAATTVSSVAASGSGAAAARGYLIVCNHTGYLYGVFADGPSMRVDDLAGDFDECTQWWPVKVGKYEVGYSKSVKFTKQTIRIKRDGRTYYKQFGAGRTFRTEVQADLTTRVDLGIPALP